MSNGLYGALPEGWEEHDEKLVEVQTALLANVEASTNPGAARSYAEAYALISGHITMQRGETRNG